MLKHSVVIKFNNVEMLKTMWKMLKTRTALTRNGLAELRLSYARQGAKAPFKTKKCYNLVKGIEKELDK